jgi:hypothetical protein
MRIPRLSLTFIVLAFWGAAVAAPAAPIERDLGQGLIYFRVHHLPEDLPAASGPGKPCVLDLRYVTGDSARSALLVRWLKARATARSPVFLLANQETSPALLTPFSSADSIAGLVILGAGAPDFAPDIALPITPQEDRRAYEALERGITVDALLNDSPDKVRNDEARLAKEHLQDGDLSDPPAEADAGAAAKTPPPLIDAVLQRAIQLHRSLLAMRRL